MQERLAALRRYRNMTHEEMGKLIGVNKATYSNKERGLSQFVCSEMFIIADHFDMRIEDIFLNPNFENVEAK